MSEDKIWDWGRVTMGIEKPTKEPASVNEMRLAMEIARRDCGIIARAFTMAEAGGMSGEDKYATLAYYALRMLEDTHKQCLQVLYMDPKAPIIIKDSP